MATPGQTSSSLSPPGDIHNTTDVLFCNIRSLHAHLGELQHRVDLIKPTLVGLNETWLDDSTGHVELNGYTLVCRRDRSTLPNRGGIALYARTSLNCTVKIEDSKNAELS